MLPHTAPALKSVSPLCPMLAQPFRGIPNKPHTALALKIAAPFYPSSLECCPILPYAALALKSACQGCSYHLDYCLSLKS